MMKHLKLVLITFATAFMMLAYQNCQKMGFKGNEEVSSSSVVIPTPTDISTSSFELNYTMGFGRCFSRCVRGSKISADLNTGVVTVNNSIMENPMLEKTSEPGDERQIRTAFEFLLTEEQLENLKLSIKGINFDERFAPACGGEDLPCTHYADMSDHTHYFKTNQGELRMVFTKNGIHPNVNGTTYWVMDNAQPLACVLKSIVESGSLNEQEQDESLTGLKFALGFYASSNPLECAE